MQVPPALQKNVLAATNFSDTDISTGKIRPSLITAEPLQSSLILLDSKDAATYGISDPFNFSVDIGINAFRTRAISLQRVMLAKPNNVTINNNTVTIEHSVDGVVSFTLSPGLYGPSDFINEFVSKANAALTTVTISGVYNSPQRQVVFSVSGGIFMFISTCSFITRGIWFSPFASFTAGTIGVNGLASMTSGVCGFLYSRYITINSNAICRYELTASTSSDPLQPDRSVGLCDISQVYTSDDFSVGVQFSSNIRSIDVSYGARINVLCTQKNFDPVIDVQVLDEWNSSLNDCYEMNDGSPQTMGITIFLNFYF